MTTLEVTLPDNLAREAGEIGLLTSAAIEAMLREALRQRRVNRLFTATISFWAMQTWPTWLRQRLSNPWRRMIRTTIM